MRRDIRKFCVPELYRGDVIQKDVVQEADKQVQMVLEQALERPVAGQVKVFRRGLALSGQLGFYRTIVDGWIIRIILNDDIQCIKRASLDWLNLRQVVLWLIFRGLSPITN